MDAAQWQQHQQVAAFSRPMEEMIQVPNNNNPNNNNNNNSRATSAVVGDQRKSRPQKDQNLNCPRCNSTNTKFCYYNNYSLTQPRYFCKTCRRYWTQGGSLRNVPVGGGSRKNKRSSSAAAVSSITTNHSVSNIIPNKLIPDLNPPNSLSHLITASQNPKFLEGQDLNLAFPIQGIFHPSNNENNNNNHEPINIMNTNNNNNHSLSSSGTTTNNNTSSNTTNNNNNTSSHPISALELLRTGIASRGSSLNPYVPMPMPDSNTLYPSGFPNLQEFKSNMSNVFSPSGDHNTMVGSGDNNNNNGAARLLFPFADMNKLATSTPPTTTNHHHHHHQQQHDIDDQTKGSNDHHHHHQGPTNGYWSGMLGGGTW